MNFIYIHSNHMVTSWHHRVTCDDIKGGKIMGKQIRGHLHVTFQGLFCYQAILAGAILTGNPPMKPKLINSAHMTHSQTNGSVLAVAGCSNQLKTKDCTCHVPYHDSSLKHCNEADQHCFRRSTISWNVGRFSLL